MDSEPQPLDPDDLDRALFNVTVPSKDAARCLTPVKKGRQQSNTDTANNDEPQVRRHRAYSLLSSVLSLLFPD